MTKTFKQIMQESTMNAGEFARVKHAGQTRSDGSPYISHPVRVARIVRDHKRSKNIEHIINAALLHDTVEDTQTTLDEIEALFGQLAASLVAELTSDPEKIKQLGKTAYLQTKMANMTSYGLVVKLADRLDNVSDLKTAKNPKWRAKYKQETIEILDYLEKHRSQLSPTHRKLIAAIRAKVAEVE